jgi:hypothetical protein
MSRVELRAARANRVFCTDKKRPRRKRGLGIKQGQCWFLYKIGDCARMALSSVRKRRSARTGFRPRDLVMKAARRLARCARQPRLLHGQKASVQKTRFGDKTRTVLVLIQDRRLRADGFIIRAQAAIRADGFSSAQLGHEGREKACALRAPTAPSARTKGVRAENAVMGKTKQGLVLQIDPA